MFAERLPQDGAKLRTTLTALIAPPSRSLAFTAVDQRCAIGGPNPGAFRARQIPDRLGALTREVHEGLNWRQVNSASREAICKACIVLGR